MDFEYIVYRIKIAENAWDDIVLGYEARFNTETEAEAYLSEKLSTPSNLGPFVILKQYSPPV